MCQSSATGIRPSSRLIGESTCCFAFFAPLALAAVVVPLQDGLTAMMCACQEGHEHVLEALLKGGATVDIQEKVIPVIV